MKRIEGKLGKLNVVVEKLQTEIGAVKQRKKRVLERVALTSLAEKQEKEFLAHDVE